MRPLYASARSACRSLLRSLLGCDCHKHTPLDGLSKADVDALVRGMQRIAATGGSILSPVTTAAPAPGPEWAPLAEPAEAAMDALWKVPQDLRGRRWYDAFYYLRDVKAKALEAGAAQAALGQGAP